MTMISILRRWSGLILCILTLMLLAPTMAQAQMFWPFGKVDTDEDGIDDVLEAYLINQYRPTYYFDSGETFWPSSVTWHAAHSSLERNGKTLVTETEMAAHPEKALLGHLYDAGNPNPFRASSGEYYPYNSDYRMDINNDFRRGEGYDPNGDHDHASPDFMSDKGVYANVQLVTPPLNYDGGSINSSESQLYLIQYWQFFSYDDAPTAGDHEADWVFLDVYCKTHSENGVDYPLVALVYHHHGDGNCAPDIVKGNDLPSDGIIKCYIEDDTHEWYAYKFAHNGLVNPCGVLSSFDGEGPNYRVKDVINLGQRFAPMSRPDDTDAIRLERRLALFYNGDWGKYNDGYADCPPGPAFQNRSKASGIWSVSRPLWVGYVNSNYSPISNFESYTSTTPGYGTHYYPFLTMSDALAAGANVNGNPDGNPGSGVVRIKPYEYTVPVNSGNLRRITQPMRLEANGAGVVRIRATNN